MKKRKTLAKLPYDGERLVQDRWLLKPQRVENLARFNFFTRYISAGSILDYGCGSGEGTHFLSTYANINITGLDISLETVKFAKHYYRSSPIQLICGNVLSPPFHYHFFDGIISVEVIEHLHTPQLYLRNVVNLLRPDGVFMLTTPNQLISSPSPGSLWPDHMKEYSPQELRILLLEFFGQVTMLGEFIPVYEENFIRKLVKKVSPRVKSFLPKWLRVRILPFLFSMIKNELKFEDVVFTEENIDQAPTIVAVCKGPIVAAKNQGIE